MKKLIIKAVKCDGGYRLEDNEGNCPQEGLTHPSRQAAYQDAALLWPYNSTWQGRKVQGGYEIVID